jgi:ribosomal 50S subunit-recycling heat shock protein
MRLDKYLKISRVIKRRTIAKDVIDLGFVKINGRNAKPSTEVNVEDILELTLGDRILKIKVKSLKPYTKKEDSDEMYEILDDKMVDNL